MKRTLFALLALAASAGIVPSAQAQDSGWPNKPVRVIVPYVAGGAADTIGRVFADALSQSLGQQFYIENHGGGGGLIGDEMVARSAPDGYTLIVSGMPSHVLGPAMSPSKVNIDPMRDFTHIGFLGGTPNALVVHPSLGVKTFKEFLARAKSASEPFQYVSPGLGSVGNMVGEYLASQAGIKLSHITYRGGGAAIQDLIAGHVKVGSMTWSTTREHIRAGTLIALAISSETRLPDAPDLPTMKELGYPNLVTTTWFSISGPAGIPKDIVEKLNREIVKALDNPRVKKQIEQESVQTKPMTAAEFTQFMQSEIDKWVPVVNKIKPH
jgi:tripartite-type tricarboxylate transporter receptor subunit TctC